MIMHSQIFEKVLTKLLRIQPFLLDKFVLAEDNCQLLSDGIRNGTTSIVSDGSFNLASLIGPVGTSVVIPAPTTECLPRHWAKGCNWVTSPASLQLAYRSELTGVIASLIVIDVLVRHHSITEGAVTIALDGKTAMEEASGDWPLSIDQKCFDYNQSMDQVITTNFHVSTRQRASNKGGELQPIRLVGTTEQRRRWDG